MPAACARQPGDPAAQPPRGQVPAAVLLCSDGERSPGSGRAGDMTAAIAYLLRRRHTHVPVVVVPRLCSASDRLPAVLGALRPRRLVIGCPHGEAARPGLAAILRAADLGTRDAHVAFLPSRPAPAGRDRTAAAELGAAELGAAVVSAALARVLAARPDAQVRERRESGGQALSRRGLFRFAVQARQPVPDLEPIEAAAADLLRSARRLPPGAARGVVLACANAGIADLVNERWLPLEVPSLELVTIGWLLQLPRAGVQVALAGCADAACSARRGELAGLCGALGDHGGVPLRPVPGRGCAWCLDIGTGGCAGGADAEQVTLREPAATVTGLRALLEPSRPAGAVPLPGSRPGAAAVGQALALVLGAGPAGPRLSAVELAAGACSSCGICARVCATGALRAEPGGGLTFDPALCTGCDVCVAMCPEGALSRRPTADPAAAARGRQPAGPVAPVRLCSACGQPSAGGIAESVVAARLAASFPAIAARLRDGDRCADCLLRAS